MQYKIYGGYKLPTTVPNDRRVFDFSLGARRVFWRNIEELNPGLPDGLGCYLFAVRAGKGIRPWYVGQTRGSFRNEVFAHHKQNLYREAYDNRYKRGTAIMFFIVRHTPTERLSTALPQRESDFIENMLIGLSLRQNYDLLNKRGTQLYRELTIPGLLNPGQGKQDKAVQALRSTLGV